MKKTKLIYPDLSYELNGIFFETHNNLGRYCNEKQYCDFIEKLLVENKINYEREKVLPPSFKSERKGRNRVDFLVEDKIILEIKTKRTITKKDYYQIKRYLATYNKKLGMIVNFREKHLKPKRILHSPS